MRSLISSAYTPFVVRLLLAFGVGLSICALL